MCDLEFSTGFEHYLRRFRRGRRVAVPSASSTRDAGSGTVEVLPAAKSRLLEMLRMSGRLLLLLLNLYVAITRVRQRGNFACRASSIHFDIPELIRLFEGSNGFNDVNGVPC